MAPVIPNPKNIRSFRNEAAFEKWLRANHDCETELWLKFYKKASGVPTVTYAQALDVALCWGWIDGLKKSFDEEAFLQRFTPRRPKSIWSQINRGHIARLTKAGRMTPHGQRHVDAARTDGRWAAAYAPIRTATEASIPADLRAAIRANPRAGAMFRTLNRQNLFALAFRTNNMKTPAGRAKKIASLVAMLARGETILGLVLLLAGAAAFGSVRLNALANSSAGPQTSDAEITLSHGGRSRSYILHVPPKRDAGALPVVIAFHGGGGNAPGFRDYAGLNAVADRERFIVVYPNGTGPLRNALLTFNAGDHCCGPAQRQKVDDVGFAVAALEDVARRESIDRRRVYATGHSNGAIMAYRLAAERADVVAAIAPVAGAMSLSTFSPSRHVPVLHIHSVDDPRALYNGGVGPPFPGTDNRVTHAPVVSALGRWITHNGCRAEPTTAEVRRGKAGTPDATHTATRLVYAPCASGADVVHWKLTVAGHGWPAGPSPVREQLSGPRTSIINAAEEIWSFVSRHSR